MTVLQNQYAEERVDSTVVIPEEYRLESLYDQLYRLAEIFDLSLDGAMAFANETVPRSRLPDGAMGWGAFPSPYALARRLGIRNREEAHCAIATLVLEKLQQARPGFENYDAQVRLTPEIFLATNQVLAAYGEIASKQEGDIWIVPLRNPQCYMGGSARWACGEFVPGEFALGLLSFGLLLLTHPYWISSKKYPWVLCPGETILNPGRRMEVPSFHFYREKFHFCFCEQEKVCEYFTTVSAFVM